MRLSYLFGCEHSLRSQSCILPVDSEFALTDGRGSSVVLVVLAVVLQWLGSEDT